MINFNNYQTKQYINKKNKEIADSSLDERISDQACKIFTFDDERDTPPLSFNAIHAERPVVSFKYIIIENKIIITDEKLPRLEIEGDALFQNEMLQSIDTLLQYPKLQSFFRELKLTADERGTALFISEGSQSQMDSSSFEDANSLRVELTKEKGFAICLDKEGKYDLEPLSLEIILAHELTHAYHYITDALKDAPDEGGFDTYEELITIGTIEGAETQKYTENAYRLDMGLNLRAGHYGIMQKTPTEEEYTLAMRASVAMGYHFEFLKDCTQVAEQLYDFSTKATPREKLESREALKSDVLKIIEHANSGVTAKRAFAHEKLRSLIPYLKKLSPTDKGSLFIKALKTNNVPFIQECYECILDEDPYNLTRFQYKMCEKQMQDLGLDLLDKQTA